MQLNDFNFDLPLPLIASYPTLKRSHSRLMSVNTHDNKVAHQFFYDITSLLNPGDLLVFNDTKVLAARLMAKKITGGQVEVLVERVLNETSFTAQIRCSKSPKIGDLLIFSMGYELLIVDKQDRFYTLMLQHKDQHVLDLIENIGQVPLPPYIARLADETDKERYQTVYAKHTGSVAAPTAGFHFDETLLQTLSEKKIKFGFLTLHIGAGTFAPVRAANIASHVMHNEYLSVTQSLCEQINETKRQGKRVIAVGTTSLRALETASQSGKLAPYEGETNLFIYPGYEFKVVDALITNFHLPCSTLLMLVCAFSGYDKIMAAYRKAVEENYRFYSYGDAMWTTRPGASFDHA